MTLPSDMFYNRWKVQYSDGEMPIQVVSLKVIRMDRIPTSSAGEPVIETPRTARLSSGIVIVQIMNLNVPVSTSRATRAGQEIQMAGRRAIEE